GDHMLYAASLPKICIMLAVYQKAAEGRLQIDDETYAQMVRMIRRSTNDDSTALMHKVDKDYIARVMLSPRYRLYDPYTNGGLWAGKDYAAVGAWRRDPMYNISHGATAMQVAHFYYLLQTGRLVSPQASREMKEILRYSQSDHKFLRGIREIRPDAIVYRKAGTWGNAHADGALIERRDGATYIAVGLAEDPMGGEWLKQLIIQMDRLIDDQPYLQRVRRTHLPAEGPPASVSAGGWAPAARARSVLVVRHVVALDRLHLGRLRLERHRRLVDLRGRREGRLQHGLRPHPVVAPDLLVDAARQRPVHVGRVLAQHVREHHRD